MQTGLKMSSEFGIFESLLQKVGFLRETACKMLIKLLQINLLESAFAILHCLSKLDIMVSISSTLMNLQFNCAIARITPKFSSIKWSDASQCSVYSYGIVARAGSVI